MQGHASTTLARRALLRAWLALPPAVLLAACGGSPAPTPTAPPAALATPAPTATTAAAPTTPLQPTATAAVATRPATATTAPTAPPATKPVQPTAAPPQAAAQTLPPTPACDDDDDDPTPAQTEGPYFKRSSPERASLLEAGMGGTKLVISGLALSTDCRPIARRPARLLAGRRQRRVRQYRLPLPGPPVHRRRGPLPPGDRRARASTRAGPATSTCGSRFPAGPSSPPSSTSRGRRPTSGTVSSARPWWWPVRDASGGKAGAFDFVLNLK